MADDSGEAPKSALPEAFAKATPPVPQRGPSAGDASPKPTAKSGDEKPASETSGDIKPQGDKAPSGLRSKGVPKQRLMWATLPTAGATAGVGMYSGNPMVALIAIGLAAMVGAGALAVRAAKSAGGRGPGRGAPRGLGGRVPRSGPGGGLLSRFRGRGAGHAGRGPAGRGLTSGTSRGSAPSAGGRGLLGGRGRGRSAAAGPGASGTGRSGGGFTRPGGGSSSSTPGRGGQRRGGMFNPMNWGGRSSSSGAAPSGRGSGKSSGLGAGGGLGRGASGAGGRSSSGVRGTTAGPSGSGGRSGGSLWNRLRGRTSGGGRGGSGASGTRSASPVGASGSGGSSGGSVSGGGRRRWPFGGRSSGASSSGSRGTGTRDSRGADCRGPRGGSETGWFGRWRKRRNEPAPAPVGRPESKGQREIRHATPSEPRSSRWQRARGWFRDRRRGDESTATASEAPVEAPKLADATAGPRAKWAARRRRRRARAVAAPDTAVAKERASTRTRPKGRKARRARRSVVGPPDELAAKRAEKAATDRWLAENPVDDAGFPLQPSLKSGTPAPEVAAGDMREYSASSMDHLAAQVRAAGMNGKGTEMSVDTQQYLGMVDASTPETQKATCNVAGDAAAADAAKYQRRADDFRQDAAKLIGRKGMAEARERLNREAAAAEETAQKRRGAAAAFYAQAEKVAAS